MPSDSVLAEYRLRVKAVSATGTQLDALRGKLRSELEERKGEVVELTQTLDVLAKVGELFRLLMDRFVVEHVRSIEGVVTEGLRTIFTDQDLTFEAEVATRYNKVAIDFFFKQNVQRMKIRGHPLEAFGGGPSSVASLILKVLAMRRMKKWPLLILDETLAAVSDEYIDQTAAFLRALARKTGLHILLVTHKSGFLDHADIGYRASFDTDARGSRFLSLDREGQCALK